MDFFVLPHIEKAGTFGAVKFMSCPGSGVNGSFRQVMNIMSNGLHGIGMKERAKFAAHRSYRINIIDIANFVISVHNADKSIWMAFQKLLQLIQIDASLIINLNEIGR